MHDEKRILPVSVLLEGEYGEQGVPAGVPCVIGKNGVEEILEISLTESGAARTPLPRWEQPEAEGFRDSRLSCHYRCELRENAAVFTLWRSPEDLKALLDQAENLGVAAAVGLYQELFPAFG